LLVCIGRLQASTGVTIKTWTVDSGLPQNTVHSICQAPDGYLWLATFDGLVRFDGVRFSTFNRSNTPGINGNRFDSLLCAADGDVWAGTEGSGLTRYHNGEFATFTERDGLHSSEINGLSIARGKLWILAHGLVQVWQQATDRFELVKGREYVSPIAATIVSGVGFWKIDGGKLSVFLQGEHRDISLPVEWRRYASAFVGVNAAEDLYVATDDGRFLRLTKQGGIELPCPGIRSRSAPGCSVRSDYRDPQGHLWPTSMTWSRESGWVQYVELPRGSSLPRIAFTSLFEDREGNLWLAGRNQGLVRLHPASIAVLSKEEGLPDRNVYSVFGSHDGAMWIGTWSGGLCRIKDGRFKTYAIANGLGSNRINATFEDNTGTLWVATSAGLSKLLTNRFLNAGEVVVPYGADVRAINQDRDGAMWFGTSGGLIKLKNGQETVLTKADGLATDDVRVILPTRGGALWVAGYGGLSRLEGARVQAWREREGLPSNTIRALYEDRDGVLWIGTYDGGLGRFFRGKITKYTVQQGLFNNGAFQIFEDARANLWMSSNRGIYRVSKKQLDDFAEGRTSFITSVAFGTSDGMRNVECNGGLGPAGAYARDGTMWFPTQDGVALLNPEQVGVERTPPPVLIEGCSINGVTKALGGPIRISPGAGEIQIQYTALSLRNPERIRFRYQLEGLDRAWVDAGSRRTAYYSHMAPGHYVFRVTAAQDESTWNTAAAGLVLVVQPRFYETWWFTVTLLLLASVMVWTARQYRIWQLERAREAQEEFARKLMASQETERKRIAAELHDSLGQQLLIIKNWAVLALSNLDGQKSLKEPLDEISSTASHAVEEMRGIAYNLRPYQLEKLGLTAAIRGLVTRVAVSSNIRFTIEIDELDGMFPQEVEISIYRIVQEALNNTVKHSQATTGRVFVSSNSGMLDLLIEDNGRGFMPPDNRVPQQSHQGFGLLGIAERVRMLGGRVVIQSAPGHGSTIRISLKVQGTA